MSDTYDPEIADVLSKAAEFMLEPGRTCVGDWIVIDADVCDAIMDGAAAEAEAGLTTGPATELLEAYRKAEYAGVEVVQAVHVSRFCDARQIPYSACAEGAVAVAAQRAYEDPEEAIEVARAAIAYVNELLYGRVGKARVGGTEWFDESEIGLFTVNDDWSPEDAQRVLSAAFDHMVLDVAFNETFIKGTS